jgi:branched-chain amino acid transport system permease protein
MTNFLQLSISGLELGAIYALVALGFVAIYRGSQIFNFAQGEFLTYGALLMVTFCGMGLPWGVALALSMALTGVLGALVDRIVLRPLIGRPVFVTIIVTIFIGAVLHMIAKLSWGSDPRAMPTPWAVDAVVDLGEISILWNSIFAIFGAALALGLFFALIRYTQLGVAMRSTASDQETALAMGIPVGKIFGVTWFIAGAYAALAGILISMFPRSADADLGFVALRAFPAIIVGGLDSIGGTVLAGLLLGVLEVWAQGYINPHLGEFGINFHEVFPYIVMIGFLIVRPYGLFGTEDVERV